ncbi:MAG: carbon-nitrogen family hydrolase [Actinomycetota bacterium]|nr:carbon-nitrogen family hydrolase [Actinomycetota bacterium]MDH4352487.1 carbon-nitrogen family hydrolase [Actinomycetota bacterium]MDH5277467.1 carbon-nitrogen family hydrolase [Actinomycetota bacterium]
MRVAALQLDFDPAELYEDRVGRTVGLAHAQRGCDLVVLPELWPNGGFSYRSWADTAEPLDGPLVQALGNAARDIGGHVHLGSFVERHPDGSLTNTAVLFGPDGGQLAVYRKIHLFGFGEGEPLLMTAGRDLSVVDTAHGRWGLATCYDLRFPEMFRKLVDAGVELVIVPAAWPAARVQHWSLLARARAVENQMVVVAVGTAGEHAGKRMGGRSVVVDATGGVLAEAGDDAQVLVVEVDMGHVARWRKEFPVLGDRRL